MPKKNPTKLQAVAASKDAEKTKKEAAGLLAKFGALLGISASAPDAKMKRVTETTKHVTTEEEEGAASSEEEEEEESGPPTASSAGSSVDSSEKSSAESEEEEEEASAKSGAAEEEEEEEEARVAKAWTSANRAYKAKTKGLDAYAIHGPKKLLEAVLKATGQTTVAGALGALTALPKRHKEDARVVARVQTLEANSRKARVDAIVDRAKIEGRAGATSKAGRASLRMLGMSQGTRYLKGHIETLPKVATSRARIPKVDATGSPVGAPTTFDQTSMIKGAALSVDDQKFADALLAQINDRKARAGAGRPGF